jgi:hypothetical protein
LGYDGGVKVRTVLPLLLLFLVACATDGFAPWRRSENLLVNPSFEEGREPWFDFHRPDKPYWGTFEVSDARAYEGERSVRLALNSDDFPGSVGISGAAQDVSAERFPKKFSGRFRVDAWERGTKKQYIQVIVMAMKPWNFPTLRDISVQLAYTLGGVEEPPVDISNRVFVIRGSLEPPLGEWIPFEFNLHQAFRELWFNVPEGFEAIRVFVEVRFDGFRDRSTGKARAEVHFDDLYLGD